MTAAAPILAADAVADEVARFAREQAEALVPVTWEDESKREFLEMPGQWEEATR